jgi:hypothetical protein
MKSRHLHRDSLGRFSKILLSSSLPLDDIFSGEQHQELLNDVTALHSSSPDPDISIVPPTAPNNSPVSPARFIPPPRYASQLPESRFDLNPSYLDVYSLGDIFDENERLSQGHESNESQSDDKLNPSTTFSTLAQPPLPSTISLHAATSKLLGMHSFIPQTTSAMAHLPAYGVAAMPSARSKLAPYFSGEVHDPIEEFLQEYEELADSNGLTRRQKVETIIRYVNPSQRDI